MAGKGTNSEVFSTRRRSIGIAVFAVIAVAACQPDAPTGTRPLDVVSLAKGGGGGGGGSSGGVAPTVTSTDPPSTVRDTTIDVAVFGTGFTTGAKATWSLAGDTTQVHVKSTKVVSSSQLIARIVVPATAPVASYDVEVTLSSGKKGVGAEMFEVLLSDPTAEFWFPTDDATLGLRSDHMYLNGESSVYASGVCGVTSKIFATEQNSNSGDAIMSTANPQGGGRKCDNYQRLLTVDYGDGVVQSVTVFLNVRQIANTTYQIPLGTTVSRTMGMNETRCDGLVWTSILLDGTLTGGDSVKVTRTSANSWLVETQPYPANKAYCRADGQTYHVAARFTVVSATPLP
jgi:hypothetical protein